MTSNKLSITVDMIISLHDTSIQQWKNTGIALHQQALLALIEQNHAYNFQLWLAEDRARRDDQGFEFVYQAKREIDHCNQQRNNMMEKIDTTIFSELSPSTDSQCPVHSETPGMIIDRLSILALKIYHMHLQTLRTEVDENHRQICHEKYQVLLAQREQLKSCLEIFLKEIHTKKRTFRLYHQFKMYNDPKLNPELYKNQ